ncbi:FixH family protein [Pseudalkalibacillus caeni]|uniref:YtkA-like domain-containing protein n=1 Tax=Exobacillus caeni TaxID=2574798 RepID=A0A5R9F3F1_9BACL|nr:FixH family protein [Pseudalkalibacillus caeni]TLS38212.1 hypothetical protein FCL54_06655 [Pseudalkalibacillus caeni]
MFTKLLKISGASLLIFSMLVLAACGTTNNDSQNGDGKNGEETELKQLKVNVDLPEDIKPGEEVTIKAAVTYGEEKVEDADEVMFEIWKKGYEDSSEKIEADHKGDGVYAVTTTFEEDGIYYIVPHTTARDQHTMPKQEVTVGNPDQSAADDKNDEGDHHAHSSINIHFMASENIQSGKETELMAHLKENDHPYAQAEVSFELWKEGQEKHYFVEAKETEEGTYKAATTFKESGEYTVTVHVKKGETHEHQEQQVTVK